MEKLKNIINPGSTKDDEVMYGSRQSNFAGAPYDNESGRGESLLYLLVGSGLR